MKSKATVAMRLGLALIAVHWTAAPASAETVTIGGNMDHGLTVRPGDTIKGGFQVFLEDNPHGGVRQPWR